MAQKGEYNLVINGKKIAECSTSDLCTVIDYESPAWKEILKREVVWTVQIDNEKTGRSTVKYYMHRKNRYYFRNGRDKLCIQIDGKLPGELRYGDYVNITMTFA